MAEAAACTNKAQRSSGAAMKLVTTGLSLAGYVTVATTMGLENVLDRVEGFVAPRRFGRRPTLSLEYVDPPPCAWSELRQQRVTGCKAEAVQETKTSASRRTLR